MGQYLKDCLTGGSNNPVANAREKGSIPGSGRLPGERNCNPLQCSYLGNYGQRNLVGYSPRGHSQTRLSD